LYHHFQKFFIESNNPEKIVLCCGFVVDYHQPFVTVTYQPLMILGPWTVDQLHRRKDMPRYYAKQEVLDDAGGYVADRLLPVCDSIRVLERKLLRDREVFPLKEGQRYAGRIYVYRVVRNHRTVPHGIYVVDNNKLKKMKRMTFVEFSIEAEDRYDG
jgi:hypothetical protein